MDRIEVPRPPATNPNDGEHRRQIADAVHRGIDAIDPDVHDYGDISGTTTAWAPRHRGVVVSTTGASNATLTLPNARAAKPGLYACKNGSALGVTGTVTLQPGSGDRLEGSTSSTVSMTASASLSGVVLLHQGSADWWVVGMYP